MFQSTGVLSSVACHSLQRSWCMYLIQSSPLYLNSSVGILIGPRQRKITWKQYIDVAVYSFAQDSGYDLVWERRAHSDFHQHAFRNEADTFTWSDLRRHITIARSSFFLLPSFCCFSCGRTLLDLRKIRTRCSFWLASIQAGKLFLEEFSIL